jgi:hypothetical protein
MYWRQLEVLPLGFASKLGFRPFTKAVLVTISTNPPKWPPLATSAIGIADSGNL